MLSGSSTSKYCVLISRLVSMRANEFVMVLWIFIHAHLLDAPKSIRRTLANILRQSIFSGLLFERQVEVTQIFLEISIQGIETVCYFLTDYRASLIKALHSNRSANLS